MKYFSAISILPGPFNRSGTRTLLLSGLVLLGLLFIGPPATIHAADDADAFLVGRVKSLDRDKQVFQVELEEKDAAGQPRTVLVTGSYFFPDCVQLGETVRIWGQYDEERPDVFQARVVKGVRRMGIGQDLSGVRSRLRGGMGGGPGGGGRGGRQHRGGGK